MTDYPEFSSRIAEKQNPIGAIKQAQKKTSVAAKRLPGCWMMLPDRADWMVGAGKRTKGCRQIRVRVPNPTPVAGEEATMIGPPPITVHADAPVVS
ncbi:hypothetical protein [Ralstonia solanacearum]|uniref:hypothetical protein n=1 Tax=Ralstonia solanacearum TaxID=305 RepID=UPI000F61750B|nr:hypothetical protein [Ralstonia solanacearum]MBB6587151.1 hypothetical protein [Ralstonia solanacearum]MCG3575669.1 hypothetical protein [Ralstonia solanacearum]MCL9826866.1 hypothetical protein [Ralstonia solanacearum]MCL9831481.1 hypothetical protein [Ralstonia solanacearum]MCL9836262.1 hypothetical protein [Ralstonia solanacearum]